MIHSWLCAIRQISNLLPKMPLFVSSLDICDKLCAAYSDNQFHKEVEAEWIGTLEEWKKEGAEIYILPVSEKNSRYWKGSVLFEKNVVSGKYAI